MIAVIISLLCWGFLFKMVKDRIKKYGIANIPYVIRGGGDDGGGSQPSVQYSQPPEYVQQMKLFNEIQQPYMQSQFQLYKDVFEPQTRSLGGILGNQLTSGVTSPQLSYTPLGTTPELNFHQLANSPQLGFEKFVLPEDKYSQMFQAAREKAVGEFSPIRQQASERAAGRNMLGQGATEKYMQNLDLSQAKSVENIAVDMAIQQWQDQKAAEQMNWQQGNLATQANWQQGINNQLLNNQLQNQAAGVNWQQAVNDMIANAGLVNQAQGANWQQSIANQQLPTENLMRYLGYQPTFNLNMPQSQAIIPSQQQNDNSGLFGGLGMLGGAGLGALALGPMSLIPGVGPMAGLMAGGLLGGTAGSMFGR